jgi:hypothetical protein
MPREATDPPNTFPPILWGGPRPLGKPPVSDTQQPDEFFGATPMEVIESQAEDIIALRRELQQVREERDAAKRTAFVEAARLVCANCAKLRDVPMRTNAGTWQHRVGFPGKKRLCQAYSIWSALSQRLDGTR